MIAGPSAFIEDGPHASLSDRSPERSSPESDSTRDRFHDPGALEDGSLDAGLWALSQVAHPGERFSLYAIGEVCGCSHEWIRLLEEKALKKVRIRLRHSIGMLDARELTRRNTLTGLDEAPEKE